MPLVPLPPNDLPQSTSPYPIFIGGIWRANEDFTDVFQTGYFFAKDGGLDPTNERMFGPFQCLTDCIRNAEVHHCSDNWETPNGY